MQKLFVQNQKRLILTYLESLFRQFKDPVLGIVRLCISKEAHLLRKPRNAKIEHDVKTNIVEKWTHSQSEKKNSCMLLLIPR